MGYARIFARAVSNPGPPDNSFDGINIMPFTTLLSGKRHDIYVMRGAAAAPAYASAGVTRTGAGPTGHHHPLSRQGQVAIRVKERALSRAE